MPRYTRCPFYIDENKLTISCEDVCRSFDSMDEKWTWMDMYCDSWDWMKCPYAIDISEAYRKAEEGDVMAIENQEISALKKEVHALRTKLGAVTKKSERLQKRLDESKELVKSYQRKNEDLYRKWRSLDDKVRKDDDRIWNELGSLSEIYEQRMAYLIDTCCPDKRLYEEDVEAWAKDKEFALVFDRDDVESNPFRRTWKVVFKEDGQQDQDIQACVQEGQEVRQQESTD